MMHSDLPGFYRLPIEERRARVGELVGLCGEDLRIIAGEGGLEAEQADRMVENALGVLGLPFAICANLQVNGRDVLVPMAIEEPSVVAAASHAAKLLRSGGGIHVEVSPAHMIGQIQVLDVPNHGAAEEAILAARASLLAEANAGHPRLVAVGGGAVDIEVHHLSPLLDDDPVGHMLVVHLVVDVRDAMGANAINSMCERLAPRIERLSEGRVHLRILSNLSDRRMVVATGRVPFSALDGKGASSGEALARGIEEASVFADRDPYRAATHNKGIMNGVDAVLLACGQDWRAVEAGAHAYAARTGRYTALAKWRVRDGHLVGRLELPLAVGTVGGVVKVHPTVQVAMRVGGVESAADLAALVAAVGMAQNLGALRALAAEGIQKGHMRLHARNFAVEAGARGDEVDEVARRVADTGHGSVAVAVDALQTVRRERDLAFCDRMLPEVSRTFALSIQALPDSLREAVCVAYLLCRIVDTVEDTAGVDPIVRGDLFAAFDAALADDTVDVRTFEDGARAAQLGDSDAERALVREAGAAFRVFRGQSLAQREAIRPHVLEMSRGMREYAARADRTGTLRLVDLADLERYCWFVAGTVGHLLTALFLLEVPAMGREREVLLENAASFGLGLQMVNILKDVAEDHVRGACFLPESLAEAEGLALSDVLDPKRREAALRVVGAVTARARHHLDVAAQYTLAWPASGGEAVRLFCAVPLALAMATLREIDRGNDVLVPGKTPKVDRKTVGEVMGAAVVAAGEDRALRALLAG